MYLNRCSCQPTVSGCREVHFFSGTIKDAMHFITLQGSHLLGGDEPRRDRTENRCVGYTQNRRAQNQERTMRNPDTRLYAAKRKTRQLRSWHHLVCNEGYASTREYILQKLLEAFYGFTAVLLV
jgi:hypothetical protein